jgi:hypothetical protein
MSDKITSTSSRWDEKTFTLLMQNFNALTIQQIKQIIDTGCLHDFSLICQRAALFRICKFKTEDKFEWPQNFPAAISENFRQEIAAIWTLLRTIIMENNITPLTKAQNELALVDSGKDSGKYNSQQYKDKVDEISLLLKAEKEMSRGCLHAPYGIRFKLTKTNVVVLHTIIFCPESNLPPLVN